MSQGGEASRAVIDTMAVTLKILELVMKAYEKNTYKKELEELKKDKDSIIAKQCDSLRGAQNKFMENNFEGKYVDRINEVTGQKYRVYEVDHDGNGTPILKENSSLQTSLLPLMQGALKSSDDNAELVSNVTSRLNNFLGKDLVPLYKEELKATGNKDLIQYADMIKNSSEIQKLIESLNEKAKSINDNDVRDTNAKDFFAKSAQRRANAAQERVNRN